MILRDWRAVWCCPVPVFVDNEALSRFVLKVFHSWNFDLAPLGVEIAKNDNAECDDEYGVEPS